MALGSRAAHRSRETLRGTIKPETRKARMGLDTKPSEAHVAQVATALAAEHQGERARFPPVQPGTRHSLTVGH